MAFEVVSHVLSLPLPLLVLVWLSQSVSNYCGVYSRVLQIPSTVHSHIFSVSFFFVLCNVSKCEIRPQSIHELHFT